MANKIDIQELLNKLRKLAVISFFADDDFMDLFVLKGGNALNIAYKVNDRASMDLDFSMKQDFGIDLQTVKDKIVTSLDRTFREEGFKVFDVKLYPTPGEVREEYKSFWGGYNLEFKVLTIEQFDKLKGNIQAAQRSAIVVGERQKKIMKIDISKYEYTEPKVPVDIDGYIIYVYTPLMVVYEKLRAVCQQVEDYSHIVATNRKPRPSDFFDIYSILKKFPDLKPLDKDNLNVLIEMFKIKRVPLYFLEKLINDREYHKEAFESVKSTVSSEGELKSFDFYFDRVIDIVEGIIQALKDLGLYEQEQVETKKG